jgi:tetratricopeptide (TPR) repeat protein
MFIMRRCLSSAMLVLAAGLFAAGCGKKNASPETVTPAPAVVQFGPPPTDEEAREFATQLERAMKAKDSAAVTKLLRVEDLFVRSVSDLGLDQKSQQSFMAGVRSAGIARFGDQFVAEVEKGAKYSFIRVRTINSRSRVLFRFLGDDGLNYHEFLVARYPDGQIGAEDIHIMLTGEMFSQSIRRLLMRLRAEQDRGLLARLKGTDQAFTKYAQQVQSMANAVKSGRPADALATYRQLPPELQRDKTIQLLSVLAGKDVGDDEYITAVSAFRRDHPADPAVDLLSIDYHLLKKQYDEAIKSVDQLDKAIGGDPYLFAMRANIQSEAGRFDQARSSAERAVKELPTMEEAYWVRITVALKEKNHPDTLKWLKAIVENCGTEIDDLTEIDDYSTFVESAQHAEWLKWYAAREKK